MMEIRLTTDGLLNMSQRDRNNLLKDTYERLALYWHRYFRPKHFTHEGAREYGYTPRSGEGKTGKAFWRSYTGQKKKRLGHTRPLEFSGTSRRLSRQKNVRATSKGVKISMPVRAFNFKPRGSQIDMQKEFRTVSPVELRRLEQLGKDNLESRYRRAITKKTETIKG